MKSDKQQQLELDLFSAAPAGEVCPSDVDLTLEPSQGRVLRLSAYRRIHGPDFSARESLTEKHLMDRIVSRVRLF